MQTNKKQRAVKKNTSWLLLTKELGLQGKNMCRREMSKPKQATTQVVRDKTLLPGPSLLILGSRQRATTHTQRIIIW